MSTLLYVMTTCLHFGHKLGSGHKLVSIAGRPGRSKAGIYLSASLRNAASHSLPSSGNQAVLARNSETLV